MFLQNLITIIIFQTIVTDASEQTSTRLGEKIFENYGKYMRKNYQQELDAIRRFRDVARLKKEDVICLDLIEYALENPVLKSWTTKCEFFEQFPKRFLSFYQC